MKFLLFLVFLHASNSLREVTEPHDLENFLKTVKKQTQILGNSRNDLQQRKTAAWDLHEKFNEAKGWGESLKETREYVKTVSEQALKVLLKTVNDENKGIRRRSVLALDSLVFFATGETLKQVRNTLKSKLFEKSEDPDVRRNAANAVQHLGVYAVILPVGGDGRTMGVFEANQNGPILQEAVQWLTLAMKDPNADLKQAGLAGITAIGDGAVLHNERFTGFKNVAPGLQTAAEEATEALVEAWEDDCNKPEIDDCVRAYCQWSKLGNGPWKCEKIFRESAIRALQFFGTATRTGDTMSPAVQKAVTALITALQSQKREWAANALEMMLPAQVAVDALVKELSRKNNHKNRRATAACYALKRYDYRRSDSERKAVLTAKEALSKITDTSISKKWKGWKQATQKACGPVLKDIESIK